MARARLVLYLRLLASAAASLGAVEMAFAQDSPGWVRYALPSATRVDIPAGIFSVREGESRLGEGERLASADGRAEISIYVLPREGETPESYLRRNLRVERGRIDYQRVTGRFFAVSEIDRGTVHYSRCNFADAIHCISMRYPAEEIRAWDGIVTRISLSLRPLRS